MGKRVEIKEPTHSNMLHFGGCMMVGKFKYMSAK